MKSSPSSLDSILSAASLEDRAALRTAARHEFWRRGDLTFKLHSSQAKVALAMGVATFLSTGAFPFTRWVLEIARKWGKTYFLVLIAFMVCLRRKSVRVVYGAPELKYLAEFVLPVVDEICEDAPEDMRPRYNAQTGHLTFPSTGSHIHLFGADDKEAAKRGRGPKAVLAIFDEAGFCRVLGYVIKAVFRPSLLLTRGPIILGSTPADEPGHDFTQMAEIAESNGNYSRATLYDNPLLTQEDIQRILEEDARDEGMTVEEYKVTPTFRREYLAERATDATLTVMGDDWRLMREKCIREVPRPKFFDGYAMLDMGGVDPHALGFGYWHFELAAFVQEDELLLRDGENTAVLAERIKEKETAMWGKASANGTLRGLSEVEQEKLPPWLKFDMAEKAEQQPYLRISDTDTQMVIDLHELHGLTFLPTRKDQKKLQVNAFRVLVRSNGFVLHPRCRNTDRHLSQTVWANARMLDYKRNAAGEHGDLLDQLVYGNRNWHKNRNPMPKHWDKNPDAHWIPEAEDITPDDLSLKDAWGEW